MHKHRKKHLITQIIVENGIAMKILVFITLMYIVTIMMPVLMMLVIMKLDVLM